RYFGGGMIVAPDAEPDDGTFDVVTLQSASKLTLLKDLRLVYRGAHRDHPAITIERAKKVRAEPAAGEPGPVLLDIDGEPLGRLPATFEVIPRALSVLC
ncbi:MAG: diacylglycerol kinase family lipid kinase, partial [Hyphomicrobiales bacterium]|nr:diacylglycerol kinase family lipid kinase [Hyphomicrobiales bacterium]